jgi:hypothetical protein
LQAFLLKAQKCAGPLRVSPGSRSTDGETLAERAKDVSTHHAILPLTFPQ